VIKWIKNRKRRASEDMYENRNEQKKRILDLEEVAKPRYNHEAIENTTTKFENLITVKNFMSEKHIQPAPPCKTTDKYPVILGDGLNSDVPFIKAG